ncbi:MAG: hypothetical protein HRU20_00825 [Pseudomonadales bacterium]|nr:hypothetical protein [Pseudomonadales bacterium]
MNRFFYKLKTIFSSITVDSAGPNHLLAKLSLEKLASLVEGLMLRSLAAMNTVLKDSEG